MNITIRNDRTIAFDGRAFEGEAVALSITGLPSTAPVSTLYATMVAPDRSALAVCPDFTAGASAGTATGTLFLCTEELQTFLAATPAGRIVRILLLLHDGDSGEVWASGFMEVVAAPMPESLKDLGDLADPLARVSQIAPVVKIGEAAAVLESASMLTVAQLRAALIAFAHAIATPPNGGE